MKTLTFCLAFLLAVPAAADTCKYEDAEGRIVYTNIPLKGAKKLSCFGFDGSPKQAGGGRENRMPRAGQPTPADFPRVDANTQKQRDDTRRKILEEELLGEQKALEQAKKAYAEGEADPETFKTTIAGKDGKPQTVTRRNMAAFEEKMKQLQDNVNLHEKNIQMLQKELAGIK
ncbi:MAG TPA: DUF4124 domain-containing protein [Novimethylophilus sp.]|jgi:hypothetical protein|uniref:DUF4124 domain-containing protein n=1 Tax=Novimethylophilus sp. TaxID=2137426 RepID=UPI002F3FCF84